jgi:hypothetical protein
VEPGREHIDDHVVIAARDRSGKLLITRSCAERGDNGCLHEDLRMA